MAKGRLNIYASQETLDEIEQLAEQLSMTKTGVGSLAVDLGIKLLKLSRSKKFADMLAEEPEVVEKLERMAEDAKET